MNNSSSMKKYQIVFLSLILLSTFSANSQDLASKKWKFSFQLDNRFSSIRNQEITVFGAKVGFQYKKLTRIGLGSSFIINPVYINYFNKKINKEETNKISFWYFSIFIFSLFFLVFTLANLGLPGMVNFVGEFLVLIGT